MAKLQLRGVHVYKKIPGKNAFQLSEIHPAMRIGSGENHLYIQNGEVFAEGGDRIPPDQYPGWFLDELGKVSPKALQETGFSLPRGVKKA